MYEIIYAHIQNYKQNQIREAYIIGAYKNKMAKSNATNTFGGLGRLASPASYSG